MTGWKIQLDNSAKRERRALPSEVKREATELLQDLEDGGPGALDNVVELDHYPGTFRAYFYRDQYRIIFQVMERKRLILVKRFRLRSTAYRGLKHPNP